MTRKPLLLIVFLCLTGLFSNAQVANGRYKELYENGKVSIKGYYKSGQKDRLWFYYDRNGMMTLKEKWKHGEILWKVIYEEGKVSKIVDHEGNVRVKSKCGC